MRILLVVYDNDSFLHLFPQGLGHIAAVLEKEGYDFEIYNQDMHHYPDAHLTEYLDRNHFDMVGVSVIAGYYQYHKLLALSEAINRSKDRPFYIIGGYGPTPEPEFFLRKTQADVAVLGEGEETCIELMRAVAEKRPLASIKGIAYRDGQEVVINERRPLIEDVDSLPRPAYHRFPMDYYRLYRFPNAGSRDYTAPMMSGRGCPFTCTFCYRMDPGHRARSTESIIDEARYLNREFGINYVAFYDDLLMSSVERTEEISKAFIKANLGVKWSCNGRLNYVRPDLMKLMRQAGCVFINYGIEAMDNTVLKNMRKALRVEQIVPAIETTLECGISPGLNIIFGNIGDNRQTLQEGVNFLLKYDDFAQMRTIRPVTPYPGSPLYYDAIKRGLLAGPEDFYEVKHVNSDLLSVNFTELSDDEFYECLKDANKQLLNNYYGKAHERVISQTEHLYDTRDASFRGYRHS